MFYQQRLQTRTVVMTTRDSFIQRIFSVFKDMFMTFKSGFRRWPLKMKMCLAIGWMFIMMSVIIRTKSRPNPMRRIMPPWPTLPMPITPTPHPTIEDPSLCPRIPPNLTGPLTPQLESPDFAEIGRLYPSVRPGGTYRPPDCTARHRVAIVVPYRDRIHHLKTLLLNLHGFLMKQQLDYGIFVLEQTMNGTFNKAMLMNIGFLEAMKRHDYQCVVFHDVDLLPEDDRNIYSCPDQPRHLSAYIDVDNYTARSWVTFGGVTVMKKDQFVQANGYPNIYFGWGGEDNEMAIRLELAGLNRTEYDQKIARYHSISHQRDSGNPMNLRKNYFLKTTQFRMQFDGLSSVDNYEIQVVEELPTHTRIQVYINEYAIKHSLLFFNINLQLETLYLRESLLGEKVFNKEFRINI